MRTRILDMAHGLLTPRRCLADLESTRRFSSALLLILLFLACVAQGEELLNHEKLIAQEVVELQRFENVIFVVNYIPAKKTLKNFEVWRSKMPTATVKPQVADEMSFIIDTILATGDDPSSYRSCIMLFDGVKLEGESLAVVSSIRWVRNGKFRGCQGRYLSVEEVRSAFATAEKAIKN